MKFGFWHWYLIIVNLAAFAFQTGVLRLGGKKGRGGKAEFICNLLTALGGAVGTFMACMVCDRKFTRANVMNRIYILLWLVLQMALLLTLSGKGGHVFADFYLQQKLLCIYFVLINVVTFILFALDKTKAMLDKWRIREAILLGCALIGGSLGGFLAMNLCNHKTSKKAFAIGVPVMLVVHVIALIVLAVTVL